MKTTVVLRFAIIGLLWIAVCGCLVARMVASGTSITLMSLFPIIASWFIIFVPLYKKYVKNGKRKGTSK